MKIKSSMQDEKKPKVERKIEPIIIRKTNAYFKYKNGNSRIISLIFPRGHYFREEVERMIAEQQAVYSETNCKFLVTLGLKHGYCSMKAFDVNTPNIRIDLYGEESDEVTSVDIYMWKP